MKRARRARPLFSEPEFWKILKHRPAKEDPFDAIEDLLVDAIRKEIDSEILNEMKRY